MSDTENYGQNAGLENERKKRATKRSKMKMYTFISDHTDSITPHELITNPDGSFIKYNNICKCYLNDY
jgi:hypothetical protein